MGAAGIALFCEKGHPYFILEKSLHWDKKLWEKEDLEKKKGCPCGAPFELSLSHYGHIFDCLVEDPIANGTRPISHDDILVHVAGLVDKDGKPISAYRKVEMMRFEMKVIKGLMEQR